MSVGALIGAGSSLLGGMFGKKSSRGLSDALKQATNFQAAAFEQSRADLHPFRNLATASDADFANIVGAGSPLARARQMAGEESPQYQMLKQDYLDQVNREMAARGQFFSPRAMQEITSKGLNRLATNESAQMFDRNMALSNIGLQAASMGGQLGQSAAGNMANLASQTPVNTAMQSAMLGVGGAFQQGLANNRFSNLFSQYLDRPSTFGGYNNLALPTIGSFGSAARGF